LKFVFLPSAECIVRDLRRNCHDLRAERFQLRKAPLESPQVNIAVGAPATLIEYHGLQISESPVAVPRIKVAKTEIQSPFIKGSELGVRIHVVQLKLYFGKSSSIGFHYRRQNRRGRWSDKPDPKHAYFPASGTLRRPLRLISSFQNSLYRGADSAAGAWIDHI